MSSKVILVEEATDPTTPDPGRIAVYAKTDGSLYTKDDAGNVKRIPNATAATAVAVAMAVALG